MSTHVIHNKSGTEAQNWPLLNMKVKSKILAIINHMNKSSASPPGGLLNGRRGLESALGNFNREIWRYYQWSWSRKRMGERIPGIRISYAHLETPMHIWKLPFTVLPMRDCIHPVIVSFLLILCIYACICVHKLEIDPKTSHMFYHWAIIPSHIL